MSRAVRVYCPDCIDGTAPDGLGCTECNAQGHLSVDPDAVAREGLRLWIDQPLPEVPIVRQEPLYRCVP